MESTGGSWSVFVLPKFLVSSYNVTTALGIASIKSLTVANVADTIGPPYKESVFSVDHSLA